MPAFVEGGGVGGNGDAHEIPGHDGFHEPGDLRVSSAGTETLLSSWMGEPRVVHEPGGGQPDRAWAKMSRAVDWM
jgi:hypothetical protein